MQFKHPEILYALLTLLIPIFIHLFQLQRFTKIPFTNVSFLKEIELQTRKSSRIKKLLILLTRLLAFAAIIVAFAQPYFSKNDSSKEWFTALYLDNSLSMQAKGEQGELLKRAIHDLAVSIPENGSYTLLTNDEVFYDLTSTDLKDVLKNVKYTPLKSDANTVLFKIQQILENHSNQHQKALLLSDFQKATSINKNKSFAAILENQKTKFDFVQLQSKIKANVAIDSVYILEKNLEEKSIKIVLRNQGQSVENISLSAFQTNSLIAKTSLNIAEDNTEEIVLQLPKNSTNIRLKIDYNDRYSFDNVHYISIRNLDRIKVLVLSDANTYLERIYTDKEFDFLKKNKTAIAFDVINKQDVIILEGFKNSSTNLQNSILEFVKKGGSLVLIPAKNDAIEDVNLVFKLFNLGQLTAKVQDSLAITKIHFTHPILENVFEKEVRNFQYPSSNIHFKGGLKQAQPILSFENQQAFISQFKKEKGTVFWIAAPLDINTTNFTNAPLIVPVFYNIGKQSVQQTQLSYRLGVTNQIIVPVKLNKDAVLHITSSQSDFIPRQQIGADKVLLYTNEQPDVAGFYDIKNANYSIQNIAYNYIKDESLLSFYNMNELTQSNAAIQSFDSIKKALMALSDEQNSTAYFKYFVLFALLFLLLEILLLKYL